MTPYRRSRYLLLVIALLLLALCYPAKNAVYDNEDHRLYVADIRPITGVGQAGTAAILAMLGGFRAIAANLLWLKSDQYWHMGGPGWWRMRPVFNTIVELDPHFIIAWRTYGWHLAWNLESDAAPEDKPGFLRMGEDVFRRGIAANPQSWDLRMELAWLYYDRIRDPAKSIPYWNDTIQQPGSPIFNWHMIAHAYEKIGNWKQAFRIWRYCVKQDPQDAVAARMVERWEEYSKDPAARRKYLAGLWETENGVRRSRGLPPLPKPQWLS
jgi:tetratricopeptide (TPR) repeat protein